MIIYQKLADIDKTSKNMFLKSTQPAFRFKKNQREAYIKNEIKTLAQDNLFMFKKLLSQESEYKHDKLERNFQQSRRYKNNICHYPSINFNSTRISNSNTPLVQSYDFDAKNYKIFHTEGGLPKLKNKNNNFTALQTRYAIKNNELDPHLYKEARKTFKKTFNKSKVNKTKKEKEMSSVPEDDSDDSSSNKKSEEENDNDNDSGQKSESKESESENDNDKDSGSGSRSGSGSGGSD